MEKPPLSRQEMLEIAADYARDWGLGEAAHPCDREEQHRPQRHGAKQLCAAAGFDCMMMCQAERTHYVVLHHVWHGQAHYDLMFETSAGSALATWRSASDGRCTGESPLTPLADHRRAYLEFEGEVSGNRGQVKRVAAGTCRILVDNPSRLRVRLDDGLQLDLPRSWASKA